MENIMQMLNQKEAAPFTGTVKRWFAMRGFGFVQRDDGQRDIFLHISQLPDGRETLIEGQRIEFMPAPNVRDGRLCAMAVRIISD